CTREGSPWYYGTGYYSGFSHW
nr:immunoglobulin heavy chain junction region [Macaca mulatta]MOV35787.1 immunoglobulin heavy chain junction region [Macaca mulatta]MOV35902.1 immunoglobulin heavy chain junction region [Macaca mulatta]